MPKIYRKYSIKDMDELCKMKYDNLKDYFWGGEK